KVRRAFIPGQPGDLLLSADYSQIELRVLAHMTDDPVLVDAFARGEDIHARTAAEVFGINQSDVTANQRRLAKVVNFGLFYGLSDFGLARDTGMSTEEARAGRRCRRDIDRVADRPDVGGAEELHPEQRVRGAGGVV